jgi:hypothetical protein
MRVVRKKEDINDYVTAHDAAQILSLKMGRRVRPDYISKMAKSKKRSIRRVLMGDRWMYHRDDIEAATITQKKAS